MFESAGQNLFPRMMSTARTNGGMFAVHNVNQILHACEMAEYIDCRLNGYPIFADYDIEKGIISPNFLFADSDKKDIESAHFDNTSAEITSRIYRIFGIKPTVIWTGGGRHWYYTIRAVPLALIAEINQLIDSINCRKRKKIEPSRLFLGFSELLVTDKKCDLQHAKTVSFRTFQTRIPGTLNGKYVNENRENATVRVEQEQPAKSTGTLTLDVAREFMFYLNSLSKEQLTRRNSYRYNKNPKDWSS
jgi:hypothetical protein